MELEGKIIQDLGIQSGTSKMGNPWKKRELVLETFGNYPKKVKVTIFGEQKVDSMNLVPGKDYILSVDLESREFNGRWYTDVNVYAVRERGVEVPPPGGDPFNPTGQPLHPQGPDVTTINPPVGIYSPDDGGTDDLPF